MFCKAVINQDSWQKNRQLDQGRVENSETARACWSPMGEQRKSSERATQDISNTWAAGQLASPKPNSKEPVERSRKKFSMDTKPEGKMQNQTLEEGDWHVHFSSTDTGMTLEWQGHQHGPWAGMTCEHVQRSLRLECPRLIHTVPPTWTSFHIFSQYVFWIQYILNLYFNISPSPPPLPHPFDL